MGMGHSHGGGHEPRPFDTLGLAGLVALCMIASWLGPVSSVAGIPLNAAAAVAGSGPILWAALRELLRFRLSADLAVLLAAGAAIAIGQHFVAAEVILIMLIGGFLEGIAVQRTRGAIRALIRLAPREATRLSDGRRERVPISVIRPGELVAVAPGERVPVDGRVRAGRSSVDQSPLTGESLPLDVGPGAAVLAGSVNGAGAVEVVVERVGADTAFGRMVHLVEEAEANRAPSQRLADRYASWFLPVVLACAAGAFFLTKDIVRGVSILIIACPCALVLATPTAVSAGIGRLARRGVLVKGGAALEALGRCRSILLDKTGTLTVARLKVARIVPAGGSAESDVLRAAASVEAASGHPLARSVVEEARERRLAFAEAEGVIDEPGLGVSGREHGGAVVRVGSQPYVEAGGARVPSSLGEAAAALREGGHSLLFVAREGVLLGLIAARDRARPEARSAIRSLNALFPGRVCMLTGDSAGAARALGAEVDLEDVRSGLLPEDKTRIVAEFRRERGPVVMVGDGVNDAAALASADVGIALTDVGTDVAIEAAGVAIFGERHLEKLPEAVVFARRVLRTIRQNIVIFAFGLNALGMAAAGWGYVGPVAAAILHQFASLFVVGNSLRLLWARDEFSSRAASWWAGLGRFGRAAFRPAMGAAAVLWLAGGLYRVAPDETGVVRRFGRVVRPLAAPGLHYRLPWPVTRLDRVRGRIERLEIGFRMEPSAPGEAPPAYEWNIQHRGGRYRVLPEEATMTCGDQSLLDVHAAVQYRVTDPAAFLFGALDPVGTLRSAAESALRQAVACSTLARILTTERAAIEAGALESARAAVALCGLGMEVLGVHLQDVHPPLEVVGSFRQVLDALEEKDAAVNRAEAYRNEQIPLARGQAVAATEAATAAFLETVARAAGEADSFRARAAGRAADPNPREVTDFNLYADAIESALAGARLSVVEAPGASRAAFTLVAPAALRVGAPAAPALESPPPSAADQSPSGER